jgi:hypothetical protein
MTDKYSDGAWLYMPAPTMSLMCRIKAWLQREWI